MNTLNLGSDDEPVIKKKSNTRSLKIALGLAAVILIPTIGATLAGTIGIGTGAIEFGQGVVSTAACDSAITVLPTTSYTSDTFTLSTIVVSAIADTCDNKYFTVKVLSGSTPQIIGSGSDTSCKFQWLGSTVTNITNTCGTFGTYVTTTGAKAFTFTPTTRLGATFVDRITIESSTT
jgi:hypothetical protein